jgi:hypothetical protein
MAMVLCCVIPYKNETLGAPTHVYKVTHGIANGGRTRDGQAIVFRALEKRARPSHAGTRCYSSLVVVVTALPLVVTYSYSSTVPHERVLRHVHAVVCLELVQLTVLRAGAGVSSPSTLFYPPTIPLQQYLLKATINRGHGTRFVCVCILSLRRNTR